MRHSNGLLGLIGIILLLFAGVALALTRAATSFDVVYIVVHAVGGVLALIGYLSTGLENLRSFLGERSTKYGTSTILASVFFIAILTILNFISYRHHHAFDLTKEKVFSLSPQSAQVLQGLTNDLRMEAFVDGGVNPELADLLKSYSESSSKVSYRMIDPEREPDLVKRYGIKAANTVRLQYGEGSSQVTQPSEENLTNAIIKLTRSAKQTVCVVEGHGEPDIDDKEGARGMAQAKAVLENENYEVRKVLLATMDKVPDDCSALLVAGPTRPYLPEELPLIDAYLKHGGRAMFLLPPQGAADFTAFLQPWGVKLGNDVVVDQVVRLFQGPALGLEPLVETYDKTHEITRELKGRSLFPMTRSVSAATDVNGVTATELVKTSPSSWAEVDLAGLFERSEASLGPDDRKGPVPIAVAVIANLKKMGVPDGKEARLVVFGSVAFADNRNLEGGTFFNSDLFLNSMGWLVGQTDLLSIRPRSMQASRVNFSEGEATAIFYLSVLVLPELLLIVGLAVWWRRE